MNAPTTFKITPECQPKWPVFLWSAGAEQWFWLPNEASVKMLGGLRYFSHFSTLPANERPEAVSDTVVKLNGLGELAPTAEQLGALGMSVVPASRADLTAVIDHYFATVTPEQLEADLKKANFDFYNKIGRVIEVPPSTLPALAESAARELTAHTYKGVYVQGQDEDEYTLMARNTAAIITRHLTPLAEELTEARARVAELEQYLATRKLIEMFPGTFAALDDVAVRYVADLRARLATAEEQRDEFKRSEDFSTFEFSELPKNEAEKRFLQQRRTILRLQDQLTLLTASAKADGERTLKRFTDDAEAAGFAVGVLNGLGGQFSSQLLPHQSASITEASEKLRLLCKRQREDITGTASNEDTRRLDFLAKTGLSLCKDTGFSGGFNVWACFEVYPEKPQSTNNPFPLFHSPRAAIDAARSRKETEDKKT